MVARWRGGYPLKQLWHTLGFGLESLCFLSLP
jgi:hypothetical protein